MLGTPLVRPVPVWMSHRAYPSVRYWCSCRTELHEVSGTGLGFLPNLVMCPVPVSILNRIHQGVRYRHDGVTEVSGTGIHIVSTLPKWTVSVWMFLPNKTNYPTPVLIPCRTHQSFWHRCYCRTEHTDVSGTGRTGGIYRPCMYRTYLVFHGSTNFCILMLVLCRINRSCLCQRTRRQRPPR